MSHLTKFFGYWLPVSCALYLVPCTLCLTSCSQKHRTGKNIFHYNEQTGIACLDPAFAKNQTIMWAVHQLYNTLVQIDTALHIIPSVAKSWEISSDTRIYTFHLRNEVFFHDDTASGNSKGRKLIAA